LGSHLMGPFLAVLEPTDFLFLPPSGLCAPPPGSSVLRIHCPDLASLPVQHVVLADQGHPKEQDTEEPKASVVPRACL
jgi:hypothetical protein